MSKPITMTLSHDLSKEEALTRIKGGFDRYAGDIGMGIAVNSRWEDDTCHFDAKALGQKVEGEIEVRENDVRLELRVPMLLAGMADKILGKLKKDTSLLLEKK